jgi:Icc-related predicted phosphoesterase
MKILLMSDIGGKAPAILPAIMNAADMVLLAGDITLGAKHENVIRRNFDEVAALIPASKQVLYIPGNHDQPSVAREYAWMPANFSLLHDKQRMLEVDGYSRPILVIGFGGAKLGLYNNFAFHEDDILAGISRLFEQASDERARLNPFTILLVHDPPFDTKLDVTFMKKHVGSESIRKVIEIFKPDLAVAGHIHESPGVDVIGSTTCVNAGEARQGKYAMISITGTGAGAGMQVTFYPS